MNLNYLHILNFILSCVHVSRAFYDISTAGIRVPYHARKRALHHTHTARIRAFYDTRAIHSLAPSRNSSLPEITISTTSSVMAPLRSMYQLLLSCKNKPHFQ